jgi:hypothetical protein
LGRQLRDLIHPIRIDLIIGKGRELRRLQCGGLACVQRCNLFSRQAGRGSRIDHGDHLRREGANGIPLHCRDLLRGQGRDLRGREGFGQPGRQGGNLIRRKGCDRLRGQRADLVGRERVL